MPVLSNPLNQIGWSDLVSKEILDKFHNFLAQLYVTIGQVKGRTMLPLPPNDVTSSDKTSSKDKAHSLEGKIRSIKFEFRRYNYMDKINQECPEARPRVSP